MRNDNIRYEPSISTCHRQYVINFFHTIRVVEGTTLAFYIIGRGLNSSYLFSEALRSNILYLLEGFPGLSPEYFNYSINMWLTINSASYFYNVHMTKKNYFIKVFIGFRTRIISIQCQRAYRPAQEIVKTTCR